VTSVIGQLVGGGVSGAILTLIAGHPRHHAYTGYLEKIGDVLGIIDLVEERLLVGMDIHARHKRYFELIGIGTCLGLVASPPALGIVDYVLLRSCRQD
jgi:hypothetical protein